MRIRLSKGEPALVYNTVLLAKAGRRIEVSLSQSPIRIDDHIIGISKIARAICDPHAGSAQSKYNSFQRVAVEGSACEDMLSS